MAPLVAPVEVCESCIEISKRTFAGLKFWRGKREWKVQCEDCGGWWEIQWRIGASTQYAPMECTQRRCTEQAKHKVAARGKRKYRCDRHAGVCIVA